MLVPYGSLIQQISSWRLRMASRLGDRLKDCDQEFKYKCVICMHSTRSKSAATNHVRTDHRLLGYRYDMVREDFDKLLIRKFVKGFFIPKNGVEKAVVRQAQARVMARRGGVTLSHTKAGTAPPAIDPTIDAQNTPSAETSASSEQAMIPRSFVPDTGLSMRPGEVQNLWAETFLPDDRWILPDVLSTSRQRGLFAYGNTTQTHSRYDFAPGVLDELPGAGYTDFLSGKPTAHVVNELEKTDLDTLDRNENMCYEEL